MTAKGPPNWPPGSGSVIQYYEFSDPDPDLLEIFRDPEHREYSTYRLIAAATYSILSDISVRTQRRFFKFFSLGIRE
jgi:hypothetical protein